MLYCHIPYVCMPCLYVLLSVLGLLWLPVHNHILCIPPHSVICNMCISLMSSSVASYESYISMADTPQCLQELCYRVVGQTHPFELVQQHQPKVPEEVQKRIAYWSFPLNEQQVLDYATTIMGMQDYDVTYYPEVIEMVQTGMNFQPKYYPCF